MKSRIQRKLKQLRNTIRKTFAPYVITCSYGTERPCFTVAHATSWLKFCGPCAVISNRITGTELYRRVQGV